MGSKFNGKNKNNIDNHGKHSTRYDTKTAIPTNNKHIIKDCSVQLGPLIIMDRLKKYARKLPETIEEPTFGLNGRYPKRRKIEPKQEELFKSKSKYIGPFDIDYLTRNSINLREVKSKGKIYNIKRNKKPLLFPKLTPEIVLDFIKKPSVKKITMLLKLIYDESIQYYIMQLNDSTSCEQSDQMSIELEKYLFKLCYQKFCEIWLHKRPRVSFLSSKQFKRFIRSLLKHTRCRTTIYNMSLRKLILYNGRLTGYPKKPHLIQCINIIFTFFDTISKKCVRMIRMGHKKKANCKRYNNEIHSIKLYHKGTTNRKDFLEIVEEYKQILNADRLSFNQVADIKLAYESILKPGECIDKADLEKCANENYDFNRFQDGTKINQTDTIISEDLNTSNNDDFDFDDIDHTPEVLINCIKNVRIPQFDKYIFYDKFQEHKKKEFLPLNYVVPKSVDNYVETTEDNLRKGIINYLEPHRTATVDQDAHTSVDNFEGATKYSKTESSANYDSDDDKLPEQILKWCNEVKSPNNVILKDKKNHVETTENNSKNGSIEAIEKEVHIQSTSSEDYNIENETPAHSSREVTPFRNCLVHQRTAIVNQDINISTGDVQGTIATTSLLLQHLYQNKLLSHPMKSTSLAKIILPIVIYSDINLRRINWNEYPPSTRAMLYQIIMYFGSFKKALCDNLNLDRLSLKEKNICDRIDIEKLLKLLRNETCIPQKCFTFTEVESFLTWPLGKNIDNKIDNKIVSQMNPSITVLIRFVKNILSKFYGKVKDLPHKSGQKTVLNQGSLFKSLFYAQIRNNTKLSLKHQPSSVNNNEIKEWQVQPYVQTDPMDTNNVDMSLVSSNISTPNELNVLNNITIANFDTQFLKFKNDIILKLKNSINEIIKMKTSGSCKNIKNFNKNKLFDNAFMDDLIKAEFYRYNTKKFNNKCPSNDKTLMCDAFNHIIQFEKYILYEIFDFPYELLLDVNSDNNSNDNSKGNSDKNSNDNSDDNSNDNSDDNLDENSDKNSDENSDENSGENSDENSESVSNPLPLLDESIYNGTSDGDFNSHFDEDKTLEELIDEIPINFEDENFINFEYENSINFEYENSPNIDIPCGFYNAGVLEPPEF